MVFKLLVSYLDSCVKPEHSFGFARRNKATNFIQHQIFALDSAVVEVQEMFSSRGSLLTIAMYHYGETLQSN